MLIVSLISACAAVQQGSESETEKTTGEQLSTLHRWDDRELSLMKNLWIGNLLMTPPDSERNRVADNP